MCRKISAPTEPPKRTKRMTMKLPSIQPDLVAAPQQPRHVKEARNPVRMRLRMTGMIVMMLMISLTYLMMTSRK